MYIRTRTQGNIAKIKIESYPTITTFYWWVEILLSLEDETRFILLPFWRLTKLHGRVPFATERNLLQQLFILPSNSAFESNNPVSNIRASADNFKTPSSILLFRNAHRTYQVIASLKNEYFHMENNMQINGPS